MPKLNKSKLQRRQNALKMNTVVAQQRHKGNTTKNTDQIIYTGEEHFEENSINLENPNTSRVGIDAVPTLILPPPISMEIPSQTDCGDSNVKEQVKITYQPSSSKIKRGSSENNSQEPEKKLKNEDNPFRRNLDGGAVLSLQSASEQLKTNPATLQSPPVIINDLEPPQESKIQRMYLNSRKVLPVSGALEQTLAESNTKLYGTIKGASSHTLIIHELQMRMKKVSESSKSYTQMALKLYLRFPNYYNVLQELIGAPPKLMLKNVFDESIIANDRGSLFSIYLTRKVNTMTAKQRQCFISIGESKIKPRLYYDIKKDHLLGIHDHDDVLKPEPAITAIVLIMQGIFENWKQPISVSYLRNTSSIKAWVAKNIKNLHEIGFDVRAVVSHKDFKYFYKDAYGVNKKRVFCLSDLSSLFISFFYNFTKHDLLIGGQILVKCQYIKDCVELDSKREIPMTPKLTDKLLNPASINEVNIKSVMEVFSMSTAAAISVCIDLNLIDKSARHTVELITKMNKLYDILSVGRWSGESQKGFEGDESQLIFLTEMTAFLDSVKLDTATTQGPSLEMEASHERGVAKFKMLIKVILSMSEYLKLEKFDSLPIGRFNTEAVELFFDQVKNHSKSITIPTAKDVNSIFRQTALIHLLKKHATHSTTTSMDEVLTEFNTITKGFKVIGGESTTINDDPSSDYPINSLDYATLNVGRKDGIIYLAGFLLKKCADVHKNECMDFKSYLTTISCDVETLSMCESIMDDVKENICLPPSAYIIEFVESMEIIFRAFFNKKIMSTINKKILFTLLKSTGPANGYDPMPCDCFPLTYMKKLYLRFRIYHTLKYNNELNRTKLHPLLIVNKL